MQNTRPRTIEPILAVDIVRRVAFQFCALAPYIHRILQEKDRNQKENMQRIVSWTTKENDHVLPTQFYDERFAHNY